MSKDYRIFLFCTTENAQELHNPILLHVALIWCDIPTEEEDQGICASFLLPKTQSSQENLVGLYFDQSKNTRSLNKEEANELRQNANDLRSSENQDHKIIAQRAILYQEAANICNMAGMVLQKYGLINVWAEWLD